MIRHCCDHGMYVRGVGSRPRHGTIVYVHGLGESGLCFERLLCGTGLRRWRHLVPDLPGYGKSPWTEGPQGLGELADHFAAWLEASQKEPVVVLGHSMGGVVGLLLCERHPHLVNAFLNVEGNLSLGDCTFSSRAAAWSPQDWLRRGFRELCDQLYFSGRDDPALRQYYVSVRICDPRLFHRNSLELVELSRAELLGERLSALKIPVLYLLGVPRGTCTLSQRLLAAAGVEVRRVEEAGHWPFIDQQDTFVREMVRFLEAVSPGV